MNARVKGSLAALLLLATVGGLSWVVAGLLAADFSPDSQPVGYVGQPEVDSYVLYTGDDTTKRTRLFAIDYDAFDWSGNLHSYPLTKSGAVVKTDDWTNGAAAYIDVQNPTSDAAAPAGRNIVTRNGSTNVVFRWSALSSDQKVALDPTTAAKASTTSPVLDYLRGDRSNEAPHGKKYRARGSMVGDIIHSTPLYCPATAPAGAPVAACGAKTLFVGANDGMLHAINVDRTDAGFGKERFAYIPSLFVRDSAGASKLTRLTDDPYTHTYFVDGLMDLRYYKSTSPAFTGTLLVGALGSGGKGLYALDVTRAAATSEADAATFIRWEITNETSDFENLGYTYGQPKLATLVDGTPALIVGNGYHNSHNGKASLFVINALTGERIRELITNDGASLADRNGLSSPTLIGDKNGRATHAYAGDLNGNVWKFALAGGEPVKVHAAVSPAQSITMAPGLYKHPTKDGFIVTFVTGRMLLAGDATDASTHYAYGIWDSAPVSNTRLLDHTLVERTYTGTDPAVRVRTTDQTAPDWNDGGHKGWRTALPIGGERVVGDGAFVRGPMFQFLSTNPTITAAPPAPGGDNWWMQLDAATGGDNGPVRFDLDRSGAFTTDDQIEVNGTKVSPVGRNMGGGVRSQLTALAAGSFDVYQANYDKNSGEVPPSGPGVSGGHFDFDIYYFTGSPITVYTPTGTATTGNSPFCATTSNVNDLLGTLSPTWCTSNNGWPSAGKAGWYLTEVVTGAACVSKQKNTFLQTLYCSDYTTDKSQTGYSKELHVHEYDDKYDVTGVNMQDASVPAFNLSNAIPDPTTQFKVLVMNQYLNPAAKLAIGQGASEESVKTYGNLASWTDTSETGKQSLLDGLPTYTPGTGKTPPTVGTLVYNLPLDAFVSKDWWGDGSAPRAGLIPTQTGCVNGVGTTGTSALLGFQGERHDGALTIQLIKPGTPATALELNVAGDVRYGWRVKLANFAQYVLVEYTSFWHHPNGKCYPALGDSANAKGWVPNPPQDFTGAGTAKAHGGSDPKGVFGGDNTLPYVIKTVTNKDGTIVETYSNGMIVTTYPDGRIKYVINGKESWKIPGVEPGGIVDPGGTIDPQGLTTPEAGGKGRINWRELRK